MDRVIVYPGSIPLDTDMLDTNRNTMIGLGALLAATLGLNPIVDGLVVTPGAPGGLAIRIGPGSLSGLQRLDATAYGSLPMQTALGLAKMGINTGEVDLTLTAPTTTGQAQATLVEASFAEIDTQLIAMPYYNAAAPTQPWLGAGNNGASQPTRRTQTVTITLKVGAAAPAGQAIDPVADPGCVPLVAITLLAGQTTLAQANIRPVPTSSGIPYKLGQLRPGMSQAQAFTVSGTFVVPANTSIVRVTAVGGGGAAGTHPSSPGGGAGAGGQSVGFLPGLVPGQAIAITVGNGGQPVAGGGGGGNGGTSAFGPYMAATGGQGGAGGNGGAATFTGGAGGLGLGGSANSTGSWGFDAIPVAGKGGDGGGPGGGRGTSNGAAGLSAGAPGGGGGGGGSTAPSGGSAGVGGAGASGLILVEW